MNKKELVVIIVLYVIAAIAINVSYSKTIENIAFVIPTILTGLAFFQCLTMKELERNEKVWPIILIALFIGFLFIIAPYNDIPVATYIYNHIGAVVVIGVVLIGLVFYIDSERSKMYKKGIYETKSELSDKIDRLQLELSMEQRRTKNAYKDSVKYTTFYIYKNYIYDRDVDHVMLADIICDDLEALLSKDDDIREEILALEKECDKKFEMFN